MTYEIRSYNSKKLSLIQHNLTTVPPQLINIFAGNCEYLDLSNNRLEDLNWIYEFPHLEHLVLDSNRLNEVHLQRLDRELTKVTVLMLNKNEFSDLIITIGEIKRLFPNLEYLSLHGNPICPDSLELKPFSQYVTYDYEQYRLTIANSLEKLKFLDHANIEKNSIPRETTIEKQYSYVESMWLMLKRLIRTNTQRRQSTVNGCHNADCVSSNMDNRRNINCRYCETANL